MALYLTFDEMGPITVGTVHAADMLDDNNVQDFGGQVLSYVRDHPGVRLLLNFQHVVFLSSAAITELLRINGACRGGGGGVRLCGLSESIRSVFEITNLAGLFSVHKDDTLDAALARYERSLARAEDARGWEDPAAGAGK